VLSVGEVPFRPRRRAPGRIDIGLEDADVLLGRGELGLELRNPLRVDRAVELEERLTLLHFAVVLDKHLSDERRRGTSWIVC